MLVGESVSERLGDSNGSGKSKCVWGEERWTKKNRLIEHIVISDIVHSET